MIEKAGAVLPYDLEWPHRFEAEQAVLERALAPWLVGNLHHVGSTAVPGLAAKPTIDMMGGVRDFEAARAALEPLHSLEYQYREHRPEAHCFHKPPEARWWEATHHLHLTEPDSDIWRERLAFRDALRADPALTAEYEEWKLIHARPAGEVSPYTGDKREFVARVLAEAGIALKPDIERLSAAAFGDRLAP